MSVTLLVGSPGAPWRDFLRSQPAAPVLCLDPDDGDYNLPGRLGVFIGEQRMVWRFLGALDAFRAPHVVLGAAATWRQEYSEPVYIQAPAYRPSPIARQTLALLAQLLRPTRICLEERLDIGESGWPVGPERVRLAEPLPEIVRQARRRAQWMAAWEHTEAHTIPLAEVTVEGARLGAGRPLTYDEREDAGLPRATYAERCGPVLLIVSNAELSEAVISRALQVSGATRAHCASPDTYAGLLCSFAHDSGDDFGFGFVERWDLSKGTMTCRTTAVAPVPVRILRLGLMRVAPDGHELGDVKTWQV